MEESINCLIGTFRNYSDLSMSHKESQAITQISITLSHHRIKVFSYSRLRQGAPTTIVREKDHLHLRIQTSDYYLP